MGKLKNVTTEELKRIEDAAFELGQDIADVHSRAEKGYIEPDVGKPLDKARAFLSLSRSASELASYFLGKASLIEQKAELETMLKKRAG